MSDCSEMMLSLSHFSGALYSGAPPLRLLLLMTVPSWIARLEIEQDEAAVVFLAHDVFGVQVVVDDLVFADQFLPLEMGQ